MPPRRGCPLDPDPKSRCIPGVPSFVTPAQKPSVSAFIELWSKSGASERANKDGFLRDLCDLLGVARPEPSTGDPSRDTYVFEADAIKRHADKANSIGKMDL